MANVSVAVPSAAYPTSFHEDIRERDKWGGEMGRQ